DHLAVAVPTALPFALPVLEVDAGKNAAVETKRVTIVNHEIVEIWFQAVRGPPFFHFPTVRRLRRRQAPQTATVGHADQHIALRRQRRLNDWVALPRVLPEQLSVRWRETRQPIRAQKQHLLTPADRPHVRRAVARVPRRPLPSRHACGCV